MRKKLLVLLASGMLVSATVLSASTPVSAQDNSATEIEADDNINYRDFIDITK